MPSHAGEPGAQADPGDLAYWRGALRLAASADAELAPEAVAALFCDLIGWPRGVENLSGGRWREQWPSARRPPAWPARERLKLRLTTAAGVYIVRFAGLGRVGAEKMSRAEAMFAAGFTPEPIALRRGLLLERWIAGQPLAPFAVNRASLVDHLGAYIAFRARAFPAAADRGASVATLAEMASVNALELGGDALREQVRISLEALDVDETRLRPIHVDGRLHAWEWVRAEDGRLIKTDAIDHAGAHDLIGPKIRPGTLPEPSPSSNFLRRNSGDCSKCSRLRRASRSIQTLCPRSGSSTWRSRPAGGPWRRRPATRPRSTAPGRAVRSTPRRWPISGPETGASAALSETHVATACARR